MADNAYNAAHRQDRVPELTAHRDKARAFPCSGCGALAGNACQIHGEPRFYKDDGIRSTAVVHESRWLAYVEDLNVKHEAYAAELTADKVALERVLMGLRNEPEEPPFKVGDHVTWRRRDGVMLCHAIVTDLLAPPILGGHKRITVRRIGGSGNAGNRDAFPPVANLEAGWAES